MKHILIAFLIALGLGLIFTSKSQVGEPYIKLNENEPLLFDSITSIFVKAKVEEISAKHQFVPLFFVFDGKLFFIKSYTDRVDDSMFVGNKFGIIGQNGEVILEQKYDKIYNPNFTIANCLEIAQKGKVGLINLKTNQIIAPQFEYIVPSGNIPSHIAYGLNGNNWYEINSETMQQTPAPNYSPEQFLSELDMNILKLASESFYYDVNLDYETINDTNDNAYDIYSEYMLMSKYLENIILLNDNDNNFSYRGYNSSEEYYSVDKSNLKVKHIKQSNSWYQVIVNFYEQWIVDRGYISDKVYLLNYKEKNFYKQHLHKREYNIYTDDTLFYTKYIDSNKIEVRRLKYEYYENEIEEFLSNNYKIYYSHFPTYNFYQIKENGTIDSLKTNRVFNFTKYTKINEEYFKGDFYQDNEGYEQQKYEKVKEDTLWGGESHILTKHLELDDLYIMKNEILAEYGLKFKTKYWQDFFTKFNWYKPKYDNVDKQLNARDKHNIKVIDKTISKLQKNEWKYTKPVKTSYPAVG